MIQRTSCPCGSARSTKWRSGASRATLLALVILLLAGCSDSPTLETDDAPALGAANESPFTTVSGGPDQSDNPGGEVDPVTGLPYCD